ncbi:MAG: arsenate reductase family protein [Epsilonproteobacteria bacterium]|nr:arsenate reductase family protein [Campylobacterota bacterium]
MSSVVIFYEKPGCATNHKQKKLLQAHGCTLEVKNLLETKFSPETLISFFAPLRVDQWFNPNAPQIKNGSIDPQKMSAEQAILAMKKEPILIKRPLLKIKGQSLCGFDTTLLSTILQKPLKNIDNSCIKEEFCHTS